MITKSKLKEQIEKLPEQFTLDELVEKLIFLEKLENGMSQSERNEVLTESQVEKELSQWFK